ncbi:MAG: FxSxx-COOH system tetratricopeptide repeat protein [Ktedonobacteraceae bacterium]
MINEEVSYTSTDHPWAEWIAWQLEHEGFSIVIQAWDFRPGGNFVLDMHKAATEAQRTIAVLSPNYFTALYTQSEWTAAFAQDPTGKGSLLLPVRVHECEPTGIFKTIVYIDLVGLDESTARERLLAGVKQERTKPRHAPLFPVTPVVTEPPRFPGGLPPIWNVPYQRNSFFTGREQVLRQLHNTLSAGQAAALTQTQAISGLGGIGKTQTAVEYAYHYQHDYDAILWIRAESRETLISDFVTLAHLLKLPEQQEQDQRLMVEVVKRWFHDRARWLLIFDNADDLIMTRAFLPVGGQGHILLTTRAQATGSIAQRIEVERMDPEEGTLFLLHRANILDLDAPLATASQIDRLKAREIVQEMGGLPLALDQAGAFIEETQCGLVGYLQLYRTRQANLLKRRGKLVTDHPDSVATTWSLSFEKVEQANPVAADLLRLCAFLDPDAIPEEIISKGAPALGPVLRAVAAEPIKLNEAIADLRTYSLLRRNPDHTLTIHRLVQAVLKQGMNASTRHRWAERAVRAVSHAFPEVNYNTWLHCQQYIPQVQTCAALIDQWDMTFPEATQLLMQAGNYLEQSAQYAQADPLYQRALAISEKTLGPEHPDTGSTLHALAGLYWRQGKYELAEPLYQRALAIYEKTLGLEHPWTGNTLHQLAVLYQAQGKYELAEPLLQRALAISEKILGSQHPDTARRRKDYTNLLHLLKQQK